MGGGGLSQGFRIKAQGAHLLPQRLQPAVGHAGLLPMRQQGCVDRGPPFETGLEALGFGGGSPLPSHLGPEPGHLVSQGGRAWPPGRAAGAGPLGHDLQHRLPGAVSDRGRVAVPLIGQLPLLAPGPGCLGGRHELGLPGGGSLRGPAGLDYHW